MEELLLEDNPLKVKPRKKRCEGDEGKTVFDIHNLKSLSTHKKPHTSFQSLQAKYANLPNGRYLQAMETKFLVYDHTKPRGYRSYLSGQMPMRPVSMIASTPALVTPSSNNTFAGSGGSGGGGGPSSSASSRQQTSFPPQLSHQHQPPPSTQHQTHQPSTIGYNNTTSSSRPILPSSTGPTANNFHSSPSSSPSSSFNNLHLTNMSLVPPPRSYSQDSRFKVNHLTSMHKDVMEGRDSEVDKDVVDEGVDSIVDDYFLK